MKKSIYLFFALLGLLATLTSAQTKVKSKIDITQVQRAMSKIAKKDTANHYLLGLK